MFSGQKRPYLEREKPRVQLAHRAPKATQGPEVFKARVDR